MKVFCTLFDSGYLSRGLAMFESLRKFMPDAYLYVFAFDDKCYQILTSLALPNMKVIGLAEFEDPALLNIKSARSRVEYCWTCTPSIILYVLEKFNEAACTYIDADLYFFASPQILLDELGSKAVSIISHRYTPEYDQARTSGKYCVQFMTFKNNTDGLKVLSWWRQACIDWCYARKENGKFGDQKYLDDWLNRFDSVYELQHLGGGVAPWNVQQYQIDCENAAVLGEEIISGKSFPVIFYHFHQFRYLKRGRVDLAPYKLNQAVIRCLYVPYYQKLEQIADMLAKCFPGFEAHLPLKETAGIKKIAKVLLRKIQGRYNVCSKKELEIAKCRIS